MSTNGRKTILQIEFKTHIFTRKSNIRKHLVASIYGYGSYSLACNYLHNFYDKLMSTWQLELNHLRGSNFMKIVIIKPLHFFHHQIRMYDFISVL